ncbi:efflux RND transporter permease subunit [Nevskia sp.]|uniref:efflux RND transporter permease subunit n=1 Tax=Nevskia sp. TaxID=1929292 RepID=UPI0025FD5825|nr:efflux RND transporter permease subunit [Nevskia sp.]
MSLSGPFIARPIGTSLLAIGIFLIGLLAYFRLPVAPLPQVEFPIIFVSTQQPGASPETMAQTVAAPLERRLGQIPGVNEMTSSSALGSATIVLQFDLSRDIDGAARDVQAAINASLADLPAGLPTPPTWRKANPNDAPVLILAITSDNLGLDRVYEIADTRLSPTLSQVKGVAEVQISGAAKPAIRIQANPAALSRMGLSLGTIRTAINGLTVNRSKGSLGDEHQTWVIEANDQLATVEDFRNAIVAVRDGVPIPLSAVATVIDGQENSRLLGWYNGRRAVLMFIRKQADANVIETVDAILAQLPGIRASLPPGVEISIQANRTQTIRASVHEVQVALVVSTALVILVMFMFLRRGVPTAIAGVTVPLALAATCACMWLLDYSLDNLSLIALTVSVGFVVDDAIVVIENIVRHIEQGMKPREAAIKGAREIGFTVLSITVSLIAVFIPILFLGGIPGRLFREFSVTLAIAVALSGFISLSLTPSLCARFLRAEKHDRQPGRLERGLEAGLDAMLRVYRTGLEWTLRHTRIMAVFTLATVFVTGWLYTVVPKGFFPQQDTGFIQGSIVGAQDSSFESITAKTLQLADIVLADPDVASAVYFVGGNRGSSNSARIFINLKTPEDGRRTNVEKVIERLRPKSQKVEGVEMYLQALQDLRAGGRAGRSQYLFALSASEPADLYEWTPKLVERLKKLPELRDVSSDLETGALQLNVVVNRDVASRLGLRPADIDAALYDAFGQRQIALLYDKTDQYRVILEATPDEQRDPSALDRVQVIASNGAAVPLSAVARYEFGTAPLSINHEGQFTVVNLTFNLAPGITLPMVEPLIQREMAEMQMPGSIRGAFGGSAKLFASGLEAFPILLLTALLAVYIVLGMLYESWIHPLTILSTIPSAGIGALLALLAFDMELSLVAIIGIILLIGIVKKNAILLIDFALDAQRTRHLTPREAIFEACLTRFRPITMTTMAAVFGAVPLAIGLGTGSELRQPLGIAIIGGLLLSQLLTLFTTPVVYLGFEKLAAWKRRRSGFIRTSHAAPENTSG